MKLITNTVLCILLASNKIVFSPKMDQQEDDELVSNFSIARVNESMISTCPSYNMDLNMLVTLTQKFTESMQSRKCNKQMLANQLEQENIEMVYL